jgi:hypothetical protein
MSHFQSEKLASFFTTQTTVESIKPDSRNPRVHSPKQIKQIARSIQSFGFNVPILIDKESKILCGHGRYLAAKQLGMSEVPIIRLDHLTPEQAKAFAIADNRLTENSTWDETLLGEVFAELSELELNFSLEDTGFTMGEIDLKIEGLSITPEADPADTFEESAGPAVTRVGDVWRLGKHRILCGNALQKDAYETLMQGQLGDAVASDAPFNVSIDGHVSGNGKVKHAEFAMASGEMSRAEFTQFLKTVFENLVAYTQPGSLHFQFMDWRHLTEILSAGEATYTELKNICVWVKDRGGMGSMYRSQHEMVLVFKNGKAPHRNNIELGKYGRYRTNVWNYPSAITMSRQSGGENVLAMHPTVKPIALIADAILDCTARGNIVIDCFLGSGTTLLACERVGRRCYGMELEPKYVDLAIQRWQTLTGEKAIHESTCQTFAAREAMTSAANKENSHE